MGEIEYGDDRKYPMVPYSRQYDAPARFENFPANTRHAAILFAHDLDIRTEFDKIIRRTWGTT